MKNKIFILKGLVVSEQSIKDKMLAELNSIGVTEFASKGWIHRFLKRYSLVSRRITGSGRALDPNASEIIWDYITEVNDYIFEKGINMSI